MNLGPTTKTAQQAAGVIIENDGERVTISRSAILRIARMVEGTTSASK
jgi:hypothetical protein